MSVFNGTYHENKDGKIRQLTCPKCQLKIITNDIQPHSALEGECVNSVPLSDGSGVRELKPKVEQDDTKAYFRAPVFYRMPGEPTVDVYQVLKTHPLILSKEVGGYLTVARHVGDRVMQYLANGGYAGMELDEFLSKIYPDGDTKALVKLF